MYATVMETLPQALLSQYYRRIKGKGNMGLLKSCVIGLLRKLSTRCKHQKLSMVCPVLETLWERAQPSLISGRRRET